jgi:hypothetical protein
MNSHHNSGGKNTSLNDDLDKLGQAYRQSGQEAPPDLLDQAILNRAHRAIEKKPHWTQFGWLHGLTTAAVFVLAFYIIMNQREPVPGFKNDMMGGKNEYSRSEEAVKKQSVDKLRVLHKESEAKSDDPQDSFQNMPVAATPEVSATEVAPKGRTGQMIPEMQYSARLQESLPEETEGVDADASTLEMMDEELRQGEADLSVDHPQENVASGQVLPVAITEPTASDVRARAPAQSEAERKLAAIIKLKQQGDESWKNELELFQEQYPDFPLPDELKN